MCPKNADISTEKKIPENAFGTPALFFLFSDQTSSEELIIFLEIISFQKQLNASNIKQHDFVSLQATRTLDGYAG